MPEMTATNVCSRNAALAQQHNSLTNSVHDLKVKRLNIREKEERLSARKQATSRSRAALSTDRSNGLALRETTSGHNTVVARKYPIMHPGLSLSKKTTQSRQRLFGPTTGQAKSFTQNLFGVQNIH